ncbi:hypothetical protein GcM1_230074 [Golovinomyces cichoracearum]|uniref:Uncharacterized protein n=1 Tax=Golovinomyces cichoracearum TaxID=62708 RepID=A0A420INC5_9PEZI|nr:hypothetical protein GcM1_230074 [Golovinomyces cichoracearum]
MPPGSPQESVIIPTSTPLKRAQRSSYSIAEIFSIIEQLLQTKLQGNTSDNVFKKTVWHNYKHILPLRSNFGIGYDPELSKKWPEKLKRCITHFHWFEKIRELQGT